MIYSYDKTYTYEHFIESVRKCLKGVLWKKSVQKYLMSVIRKTFKDLELLKKHILPNYISGKKIIIYERGKPRIITPIHIKDRVIQKILCDNALTPVIRNKIIYDNGASLQSKGVEFTRERVDKLLRQAIRRYGSDFYVLTFDFKSYFQSIPHKTCRKVLEKYFLDKDIVNMTMEIIKQPHYADLREIKDKNERRKMRKAIENDEGVGICLGSQVSQIMALIIPNAMDHYIKDQMRVKGYVRYMDDGVLFGKTKEELYEILDGMRKICNELGLKFNDKKTHITKISKGFTFLKVKYRVTANGGVIKRLTHSGIVRMRRKLKKFKKKVDNGEMDIVDVYNSMQSWLAHSKIAKSYKTKQRMLKLYERLFGKFGLKKNKKI